VATKVPAPGARELYTEPVVAWLVDVGRRLRRLIA
jgi:hypothetical protein